MSRTTVRSDSPPALRLWLTAAQVAERYGVSIPTVWTWAKTKRLPVPHKLAENTTRWRLSELDAHDDKQAERGRYEPKRRLGRQE
jgi:predicted DNA-binding transcriptional regulator AlpA